MWKLDDAIEYAKKTISGEIKVNNYRQKAAQRFLDDLENEKYEFKDENCQFVQNLIETTFCHAKGSLRRKPLKLEEWELFIIWNLVGFYKRGTNERRFKESLIYMPRKNGKTTFAASLVWAMTLLQRNEYGAAYIVAQKVKVARESLELIQDNIEMMGERDKFRMRANNQEHSVHRDFYNLKGEKTGTMHIEALAADEKRADGYNAPIILLDEVHAYKSSNQYHVYQQAQKAYTNKLLIAITTAGQDMTSFLYERIKFCKSVLDKTVEQEDYFIYLCEADDPDHYDEPYQWQIANPNWGVTVREEDMRNEANLAKNSPQSRSEFLNKSLNIYTNTANTYFNIIQAQASDEKCDIKVSELGDLNLTWYGGADLSKLYDLTGTALYSVLPNGTHIAITHGFIPITTAADKAKEDNIPFYWWKEKGWLTMCNDQVINYDDVTKWFKMMRDQYGLNIKLVGYDRRYSQEFILRMRKAGFVVKDQPQRYVEKTESFREIELQIKSNNFYYLHNKAFEYCLGNIHAVEDSDEFIKYRKIMPNRRIDLFDAATIACKQYLRYNKQNANTKGWFK